MSIQIVSIGKEHCELSEDGQEISVLYFYLRFLSSYWPLHIEESHSVFRVYKANVRSMDSVEIVVHECPDWDTFASDLQSSLATIAGGDIIVLKFAIENKSLFLDIKNNFSPVLKQIFSPRCVPIIVLAVGHRDRPSCTCPMCTSDRDVCVSPLEGLQLAKDIGLGATYLELASLHARNVGKYFGGVMEYYILQTMKQKSAATKTKKRNQALKVNPPKLGQPEKMPDLKDEPSQYISDIKNVLDHCRCVDVVFCTADLNPVSAAHRVVLCSVSSVFMLLFGVISAKDVYDSCTQKIAQSLFSVHQEPEVSTRNSPVRVIVKDALFHKGLSDILRFIYSGASQWQLLGHQLKEKLNDPEEVAHVSHMVQSLLNKPATGSHSRKPLPLWESLGFFFNNTSLSDVIFQVQDAKIPAHRAVLVARCEVMAAMLSGSYMEANCALIPVYGISKDTFLAFLEYMYTDTCCPASVLQAMSLLICSEMYQVSRLQHICELCITTQLQSVPSRELALTSLNVVSLLRKAKIAAFFNFYGLHGEVLKPAPSVLQNIHPYKLFRSSGHAAFLLYCLAKCNFHNFENLYTWLLYFVATHYLIFSQKQEFQDLSAEEQNFVEAHKWPPDSYLTQLAEYRRYIYSPTCRCAVM